MIAAIRALAATLERAMNRWFLLLLAVLSTASIGLLYWQLTRTQQRLVESTALQNATTYSEAIATFRTLYTSEVVEAAKKSGLIVSHDYREREGAIPLPATLSMELAKRLGEKESGSTTSLYSPYPFPWRRNEGGLQDDFALDAWESLSDDPTRPFYRIEDHQGGAVLRYATADRMRPACVGCHNTHPDSPKRDWKTGDLRGVLEVNYPIDHAAALARRGAADTLLIVGSFSLLAVLGLGLVHRRQRQRASELEAQVSEQTRDLRERALLLRRAKEYTERVVDSMNDSLLVLSPDGMIKRVNPATTRLLGYHDHELIGQPLSMVLMEGDNDEEEHEAPGRDVLEHVVVKGVLGRREKIYLTKNGERIPVLFSGSVLRGSDVEVEAIVCVARDITKRKAAEDYVNTVLNSSPVGILVTDASGTIARVNKTLTTLFGYSEQELIGEPVEILIPDAHRDTHASLRSTFNKNGDTRSMGAGKVLKGRRKNGTEFVANVSLTATTLRGQPVVLAGVLDQTEFHEAELALRQLETETARAAGMSEIATGVLHNVGNVVNSVNISAGIVCENVRRSSLSLLERVVGLLTEHSADPGSLHDFLIDDPRGQRLPESMTALVDRLGQEQSTVQSEVQSLQEHVRHIMAIVSSQQELAGSAAVLEEIELGGFLDKAIALGVTAFSSETVRVDRQYGTTPTVTVDAHKLMQIVVNLLCNARHAIEDNNHSDRIIEVRSEQNETDSVMISVSDNGVGIAEENLSRIFEHGFTTKKTGHGFGLHISATAAMELGGALTAHSDGPGHGATFQITFPPSVSGAA
jgi:PAS domain S-box-containing protein